MKSNYSLIFWTNWLHSYSQRFVQRPVAAPSASLWCSLFQTLPSPLRFGFDHDDSEYSHCMKAKFTAPLKKKAESAQIKIESWCEKETNRLQTFPRKQPATCSPNFCKRIKLVNIFITEKEWKLQKSREESAIFRKILDFCYVSNLIVKE